MRFLLAPDKFKGSMSAVEVCAAMERGLARAIPDVKCRNFPVADGGEGTMEAIHASVGGEWVATRARDPLGREVDCRYLMTRSRDGEVSAVIEMSEASGMKRIAGDERDPLRSTTFGTGELIRDAMERGAARLLVGLGGSATNDGGAGMAAALGYKFLDESGGELEPTPANLGRVRTILPMSDEELIPVLVACDVTNPLLGQLGATRVYGPQKGVADDQIGLIENGLENLAAVVERDLGGNFAAAEGAGAAGGLGFGLLSFLGAELRPGFALIGELTGMEKVIEEADVVLTGEGSMDAQSLHGKAPVGVAALARKHGKPVVALAGSLHPDPEGRLLEAFDGAFAIANGPIALEDSLRDGARLVEDAAASVGMLIKALAPGE